MSFVLPIVSRQGSELVERFPVLLQPLSPSTYTAKFSLLVHLEAAAALGAGGARHDPARERDGLY